MDDTLLRRIERLEDIEAIKKLKAHYWYSCDQKNVEAVRDCFAEGEVLATLYVKPDEVRSDQQLGMALMSCYRFSEEPVQPQQLILEIVGLEDYLQIAWQQGTAH